jgi:hypothetical protein
MFKILQDELDRYYAAVPKTQNLSKDTASRMVRAQLDSSAVIGEPRDSENKKYILVPFVPSEADPVRITADLPGEVLVGAAEFDKYLVSLSGHEIARRCEMNSTLRARLERQFKL